MQFDSECEGKPLEDAIWLPSFKSSLGLQVERMDLEGQEWKQETRRRQKAQTVCRNNGS